MQHNYLFKFILALFFSIFIQKLPAFAIDVPPNFILEPESISTYVGAFVTIPCFIESSPGQPAGRIEWYKNGQLYFGSNGSLLCLGQASEEMNGDVYQCKVINGQNPSVFKFSRQATLSVFPEPRIALSKAVVKPGQSVTLTVDPYLEGHRFYWIVNNQIAKTTPPQDPLLPTTGGGDAGNQILKNLCDVSGAPVTITGQQQIFPKLIADKEFSLTINGDTKIDLMVETNLGSIVRASTAYVYIQRERVCPLGTVLRNKKCLNQGDPLAPLVQSSIFQSGADRDGDGFSDLAETQFGTSMTDPGSFPSTLISPAYALWNGFLGMTNILELVNSGNDKVNASVTFYKIDGSVGNRLSVGIQPGSQQDIILNDLSGFQADSYGIVTVSFTGKLDGRLFYYRRDPNKNNQEFEFAFGIPLTNPSYGKTSVGFNTFQPSTNPGDQGALVANWLSVVNLSNTTKTFTLTKFDQVGKIIKTTEISIKPFARIDLDGGHVNPGPSRVGFNEILPNDRSAPYIAQLVRYGYNPVPNTGYSFAFPLVAKPGNGEPIYLPAANRFGAENWLEVINVSDLPVEVQMILSHHSGYPLLDRTLHLNPYEQTHVNISASFTEKEEFASVKLIPARANTVVAESMYYFRNQVGQIEAMYGSQSQEALRGTVLGSYNLFLGMKSFLRIFNASSSTNTIILSVNDQRNTLHQEEVSLPGNGSIEFPLHSSFSFNTSPDTYGTVSVSSDSGKKVFTEVIRVKTTGDHLEFVAPTVVR